MRMIKNHVYSQGATLGWGTISLTGCHHIFIIVAELAILLHQEFDAKAVANAAILIIILFNAYFVLYSNQSISTYPLSFATSVCAKIPNMTPVKPPMTSVER